METPRRVTVPPDVGRVLLEADDLDAAAPRLLVAIGTGFGWELGALWLVDPTAGVLRCHTIWHEPAVDAETFATVSRHTVFPLGVGLPGQVWASGESLAVADILRCDDFLRRQAAVTTGLHGAVVFPICDGNGVIGVVEFFRRHAAPPDPELLHTLTALGRQIGQFVERTRVEQALRESEERYRRLVELSPEAIVVLGEGKILYINAAGTRLLGAEHPEQLIGERALRFVHPEYRDAVIERMRQIRDGREDLPLIEEKFFRLDGTSVDVEVTSIPFTYRGKPVTQIIARDITARRRAEGRQAMQFAVTRVLAEAATLAEALPQLLRAIGEGAGWDLGGLWQIDPQAQVLRWLDGWQAPGLDVPRFLAVTRTITFAPDDGLPGRVWVSGQPLWSPDIASEPFFRRAPEAAAEGLHAACAVPLRSGGAVTGVFELFSRQRRPADPDLMLVLTDIGSQIGQFVARKRAEEAVKRLQQFLALINRQVTLDEVAEASVHAAAEAIGCDIACLMVVMPDDSLQPRAVFGFPSDALQRVPGLPLASLVVREGRVAALREVADQPDIAAFAREIGSRSAVGVPCRADGRVVAVLIAGSRRLDEFDPRDVAVLEALADGMGVAIARAELVERERDTARRLRALGAVTDATLVRAGDPDAVFQELVDRVAEVLGASAASVRLLDEATHQLSIRAAHNIPADRWDVLSVQPPVSAQARSVREGRPVYVRDVQAEPHDPYHTAREPETRSLLSVPLRANERVIGVLTVVTRQVREFSEDEVRVLEVAADRAAAVVEQGRLYAAEQQARQAAERAADRTIRLQAVTAALSEVLTPAGVAAVVVEQGIAALGGRGGVVALRTEDRSAIEIVSSRAVPEAFVEYWRRTPLDAPVPAAEVVRTGEPRLFSSRHERLARYPALQQGPQAGGEASAILPLAIEGRADGVLLLSFAEPHTFSDEERTFMFALAQLCAQALERTRLLQREASAAAAREADRLKTELLNTVSHELRTPLAAIKGFATTLLLFGGQLAPDEQRDFLTEIEGAADRLQELVDNLLNLARLESGTLRLERAPVALDTVLTRVVEQAHQRYPDRVITLTLAARLPRVLGDGRRLEQVATNLMDNAVKYSPAGGSVEVQAEGGAGGAVQFRVTDHGIGLAPEHLERIFEQFYRVDSEQTRGIGGTGLGLAICQRIVAAHGGQITVASVPGAGSTFTVALPACDGPS